MKPIFTERATRCVVAHRALHEASLSSQTQGEAHSLTGTRMLSAFPSPPTVGEYRVCQQGSFHVARRREDASGVKQPHFPEHACPCLSTRSLYACYTERARRSWGQAETRTVCVQAAPYLQPETDAAAPSSQPGTRCLELQPIKLSAAAALHNVMSCWDRNISCGWRVSVFTQTLWS